MTHFTGQLSVNVLLVTEENELWQLIYANPGNLLAFFFQLSHFLNCGTCLHHRLMTSHTPSHARNLHLFAVARQLMTIVTAHSSCNVTAVAEWDRLRRREERRFDFRGLTPSPGWNLRDRKSTR